MQFCKYAFFILQLKKATQAPDQPITFEYYDHVIFFGKTEAEFPTVFLG